jgi:ribokinase
VITVFGSINLDLIGTVERLPRPGETVPGKGFSTAPGGKGANQALAARRAGAVVRMAGAVGTDEFSTLALALLKDGGVDLSRVRTAEGPTGVALILVESTGENVIAVIPGGNGTVSEQDAAALEFRKDEVLLLQLEVPIAAMIVAARRARSAGARVLLNYAPFRNDALALVREATHLVVNETECALLADALGVANGSIEARARALSKESVTTLIVTLGRDGVLAVENDTVVLAPALAVQPIDTVGAGDTFCGYLAAALAEGQRLESALRLSAAAGSLACTKSGAQPSIPPREDVETALTERRQVHSS